MRLTSRLFLGLALLLSATATRAEEISIPKLSAPIVDEVGVISQSDYAALDSELRTLSESGKGQVAVLVAKDLRGLTIEEFGIKLAEAWKIGLKSGEARDRGAIFIIAPNDRKMRIEVGYGLEGDLPDAISSQILEEIVKPQLRANRMSEGITAGVRAVIAITRGEPANSAAAAPRRRMRTTGDSPGGLIFLVLMFVLFAIRNPLTAAGVGALVGMSLFNAALIGLGAGVILHFIYRAIFGRTRRSGLFGGFGGWGGGGGFGGGGFGGGGGFSGGGGSFGGGGSSSSW